MQASAPDDGAARDGPAREGPARGTRSAAATALGVLAGLLVAFAPVAVGVLGPHPAAGGMAYLGLLPTAMAWATRPRTAPAVALATGALMALGTVVGGSVLGGTILMVVVAAGVGLSARAGASGVAALAATSVVVVVVNPVVVVGDAAGDPRAVGNAVAVGGVAALAGLWFTLVATLTVRLTGASVPVAPEERVSRGRTAAFAGVLAVLVGAGTWWALAEFPRTHAWWLVLTFLVVLVPRFEDVRANVLSRTAGTVLGALVASAAIAAWGGHPGFVRALGFAVIPVALVAWLRLPSWAYTTALTATVLLTQYRTVLGTDRVDERLALTLVGAAAALVAVELVVRTYPVARRVAPSVSARRGRRRPPGDRAGPPAGPAA